MFDNVRITLEEKTHVYTDIDTGEALQSVSRAYGKFKNQFDRAMMLPLSAKKMLRESGNAYPTVQQQTEAEKMLGNKWKQKNDFSIQVGKRFHAALELYGKTTQIEDVQLEPMVRGIAGYFRDYKKTWYEQIVHSRWHEVAGTCDRIDLRPGTTNVLDFTDWKTNVERGIEFCDWKYKKWMKYPLDYLEDTNYVHYSLQLSMYALMCELDFGARPGKLQIVYIPPDDPLAFKVIPVMYLRDAAHLILKSNIDETVFDKPVEVAM